MPHSPIEPLPINRTLGYVDARRQLERAMGTIDRHEGMRVVVNTDDHGVPHVHIQRNGQWAKIAIGNEETGAYILDPKRMRGQDLREAVRLVDQRWEQYLSAWKEIHGQERAD